MELETQQAAPKQVIDTPTTEVPESTPQVDVYEVEAREQGWKPKEEYEGDPNKWRPAKEFVERGELFNKIDTLGKELKETKKAMKLLQEHNAKIKQSEYNRAVDELKALQKKHLEEGNSDGYLETTELLTDLKAEQKARDVIQETAPKGVDPRFQQWTAENKWYGADAEMREYADVIGMGYAQRNPNLDPEDVLKYVTAQVKRQFADKFKNPNREKPSAVEGTNTTSSPKSSKFELTDDERRVMNTFVRTGAMTKDEFIAQVKSMRGVK